MSYIGKAPGFGIRNRYYYTATASQTLFSGADDNGQTLAYADSKYLDVFLNGVSLVAGTDYTATTLTSVSLTSGAAASDIIEIVAYDIFSVADTVSAANGGTFNGSITIDGGLSVDGGTIKLDGNYPVGTANVALGDTALDSNVSGASNTAIGSGALTANTVSFNTAVGATALLANTTGTANTALGMAALVTNETGSGNTAVGYASLYNNTASNNTAVGREALVANTTGASNTVVGREALDANTTGAANVSIGDSAMTTNTTGSNNIGIGYRVMNNMNGGTKNTVVGNDAGYSFTTGSYNACLGSDAGGQITTGSKNTIIGGYNGNQGGLDIRTVSNNIVLSDGDGNPRVRIDGNGDTTIGGVSAGDLSGTGAKLTIRDASNAGIAFQSGGANTDHWEAYANQSARFYIENNNTSNGAYLLYNSGSGWTSVSDARWKANWTALEDSSSKISALNIGKYHMLNDSKEIVEGAKWDYGVKAQELVDVIPDAVDVPENLDDKYGVVPNIVFWHAVKALQEAMDRIEALEAKVATLEAN